MMALIRFISGSDHGNAVGKRTISVEDERKRTVAQMAAAACSERDTVYKRQIQPFCKLIQIIQTKYNVIFLIAGNSVRYEIVIL